MKPKSGTYSLMSSAAKEPAATAMPVTSASAAEARFEEMGNEIPERVRGKRVALESYEVAFDVEMVRA